MRDVRRRSETNDIVPQTDIWYALSDAWAAHGRTMAKQCQHSHSRRRRCRRHTTYPSCASIPKRNVRNFSKWWHINWPPHTKCMKFPLCLAPGIIYTQYTHTHLVRKIYSSHVSIDIWGRLVKMQFYACFIPLWNHSIVDANQNNVRVYRCCWCRCCAFWFRGHFQNRNCVNGQINLISANRKVTKNGSIDIERIHTFLNSIPYYDISHTMNKFKNQALILHATRLRLRKHCARNDLCIRKKFQQIFHIHAK